MGHTGILCLLLWCTEDTISLQWQSCQTHTAQIYTRNSRQTQVEGRSTNTWPALGKCQWKAKELTAQIEGIQRDSTSTCNAWVLMESGWGMTFATYSQMVWETNSHVWRERPIKQMRQILTRVHLNEGHVGLFVLFLQIFYNFEISSQ